MNCVRCGKEVHPLRIKVLPGTKVCVDCSSTGKKSGQMTTFGKGDHTYQELTFTDSPTTLKDSFRDDEFVEENA